MRKINWITTAISVITGKKAQEIPGWAYIVGLIVGLIGLVVLIWISIKSGKAGIQQLVGLK
jgi:hypothetical protein